MLNSNQTNNPNLSWNICWKFVGAKYDFILDEIKLLHKYSGLDGTKEIEILAISEHKNKKRYLIATIIAWHSPESYRGLFIWKYYIAPKMLILLIQLMESQTL